MWEEISRLQEQGQIEKFRGVELIDSAVGRLLQRTSEIDSVALVRGDEGVVLGESERFVYADGTAFDSRGRLLSGQVVAVAYSVEVQFR